MASTSKEVVEAVEEEEHELEFVDALEEQAEAVNVAGPKIIRPRGKSATQKADIDALIKAITSNVSVDEESGDEGVREREGEAVEGVRDRDERKSVVDEAEGDDANVEGEMVAEREKAREIEGEADLEGDKVSETEGKAVAEGEEDVEGEGEAVAEGGGERIWEAEGDVEGGREGDAEGDARGDYAEGQVEEEDFDVEDGRPPVILSGDLYRVKDYTGNMYGRVTFKSMMGVPLAVIKKRVSEDSFISGLIVEAGLGHFLELDDNQWKLGSGNLLHFF